MQEEHEATPVQTYTHASPLFEPSMHSKATWGVVAGGDLISASYFSFPEYQE